MTDATAGRAERLDPLVARVLAPNPSPYTNTGTQTHLVGTDDLAVIDPGPDSEAHLAALLHAIDGRPVRAILITHTHRDHSPLSRALQRETSAPILGCAPLAPDDAAGGDSPFDRDYAPDRVLAEGEQVTGEGWTLEAVATPGHTSNHLCFALPQADALFSGDHVMGWSTTVVAPPDGDMGAYMASLDKLLRRDDRIYYPAHGDPVTNPRRLVRGMLGHRKQREGQILRLLGRGVHRVPDMLAAMYVGIDPRLAGAAEASIRAHLIDLRGRGLAREEEDMWMLAA
ncbi:MBL fold metallo-hydrolase [Stakelama saccharophila]|uniref:MBL fold metallo-hydrolase n=1 Tax=Stakelama saccharophila TaxID=3075605 RepID=A0ABZ0B6N9_9SPHN|nr:MBL fold metallo-hydrolase [Stakelama sp. W311]WNO53075.1 MBL fold metallo-hydrolase [Stakelama sp. W311]